MLGSINVKMPHCWKSHFDSQLLYTSTCLFCVKLFLLYISFKLYLFRWILDNFSFLIPHIIEATRRNTVSVKAKAAAGRTLDAAPTPTPVEVLHGPDNDFILDIPEMPAIIPCQSTLGSSSPPHPSKTETTMTIPR